MLVVRSDMMDADAERIWLERIRAGDQQAWVQLIERFQGRLLAFARMRAPRGVEPEDLVQEVFISFIQSVGRFRHDCSLETYLFSVLRRRLVDNYRQRDRVCLLQDQFAEDSGADRLESVAGAEPSVSWYAVQQEQRQLASKGLAEALTRVVDRFKASCDLEGLKMLELLFYCQLPSNEVARVLGTNANQVRVFRHRCIRQVREYTQGLVDEVTDDQLQGFEGLLAGLWQEMRMSCPKRMTIGGYLLGTLEPPWHEYVHWHIYRLGCHFCKANLEDLQTQVQPGPDRALRSRIMESTVGFFLKPKDR